MAQPKEPPLSIRPGAARLARIDAYAKERALSRHLAILVLIDAALAKDGHPLAPAQALAREAGDAAVKVKAVARADQAADRAFLAGDKWSVPFAGDLKRAPMQKTPKKR